MADIIKTYVENAPAARLIGLRYGEKDRSPAGFAHKWGEWFAQGRFAPLEPLAGGDWAQAFPEAGSYLGLMRWQEPDRFEYWIGLFTPPDTPVPEGYESLDVPAARAGVCWVKGNEPGIYHQEEACREALEEQGLSPWQDSEGWQWVIERYQCPRFTQPDEQGEKILDLVFFLKPDAAPAEDDLSGKGYCASCRQAYTGASCPECKQKGSPLQADDPILIGELPGRLRNALQIAFGAGEIPFNALATLGSGFTLAAGELFETYKIYVPAARESEARAAFQSVFDINRDD